MAAYTRRRRNRRCERDGYPVKKENPRHRYRRDSRVRKRNRYRQKKTKSRDYPHRRRNGGTRERRARRETYRKQQPRFLRAD